jgi:hypothetical protein
MNKQNLTHAFPNPVSVEIGRVAHRGPYQTERRMVRAGHEGQARRRSSVHHPWGVCAADPDSKAYVG